MNFEHATPEELSQAEPVPRVAPNGVQWLPVPGWEKIHWLWLGFSTRKGGSSRAWCAEGAPGELNLGFTAADSREVVARNRRLLAEAVTGDPATPLVTVRQIHSTALVVAGAEDAARERPRKADGLMTDESGLLLGIQTADCIPVLVADRKRQAVAVEVYDTDPVRTKYPMLFLTQRAPGHSPIGPSLHLDLVEANRRQLLDAGLKPRSIQSVGGCTSCQPALFFSHRASRGHAGRMLSVIGIRPR
jgi:copper oxidase (laccase) domain-containing protein